MKKRVCNRCGHEVKPEPNGKLMNEDYPWYCPYCDENMFNFETHEEERKSRMKTYVIYDNDDNGFVESVGASGIFRTPNLDSAFQFPNLRAARDCAGLFHNAVILEWKE